MDSSVFIEKRVENALSNLSSFSLHSTLKENTHNQKRTCESAAVNSRPSKPRDNDAFLKRIHSFSSGNWFGKPLWLSPVHCARYGWANVETDLLRCVTCRSCISAKVDKKFNSAVYAASCERLDNNIREGHHNVCPWKSNSTPDVLCRLTFNSPSVALSEFVDRMLGLSLFRLEIPFLSVSVLNSSLMINVDMIDELCSWAVEQFDDLKQYDLAQLMPACVLALCGWHKCGSVSNCLIECKFCNRQVGLWNYFMLENSESKSYNRTEEDESEDEEIFMPELFSEPNETFTSEIETDETVPSVDHKLENCSEIDSKNHLIGSGADIVDHDPLTSSVITADADMLQSDDDVRSGSMNIGDETNICTTDDISSDVEKYEGQVADMFLGEASLCHEGDVEEVIDADQLQTSDVCTSDWREENEVSSVLEFVVDEESASSFVRGTELLDRLDQVDEDRSGSAEFSGSCDADIAPSSTGMQCIAGLREEEVETVADCSAPVVRNELFSNESVAFESAVSVDPTVGDVSSVDLDVFKEAVPSRDLCAVELIVKDSEVTLEIVTEETSGAITADCNSSFSHNVKEESDNHLVVEMAPKSETVEPTDDMPTETRTSSKDTSFVEEKLTGDHSVVEEILTRDSSVVEEMLTKDPSVVEEILTRDPSVVEEILTRDPSVVEEILTRDPSVVEEILTRDPSVVEEILTRDPSVVEEILTRDPSVVEEILTRDPSVEEILTRDPSVVDDKPSVDHCAIEETVERNDFVSDPLRDHPVVGEALDHSVEMETSGEPSKVHSYFENDHSYFGNDHSSSMNDDRSKVDLSIEESEVHVEQSSENHCVLETNESEDRSVRLEDDSATNNSRQIEKNLTETETYEKQRVVQGMLKRHLDALSKRIVRNAKRRRLTIIEKSQFDPVKEHHPWCIWVTDPLDHVKPSAGAGTCEVNTSPAQRPWLRLLTSLLECLSKSQLQKMRQPKEFSSVFNILNGLLV